MTMNREQWLTEAVAKLAPLFEEVGTRVPPVRVSVGWPGGRGKKDAVIGQCWRKAAAADEISQLFISPVLDDAVRVLDVLTHELCHATDDCESGHRGHFAKLARRIGLDGKLTATVAGPDLAEKLEAIAEELGEYPHAALSKAADIKKQTTRMLKAECPNTKYLVRLTRKWVDTYGAPLCPCCSKRMEMEEA